VAAVSIFLGQSTADIAATSSPQLLAHHCIDLERRYLDAIERHAGELRELRALLSKAEGIGLRALHLQQQGRKTARLADLIDGA
jgi:hypothetical protein